MDAEERLLNNGFEDVVYFTDYSYDDALIGVSDDNRAIYNYNLMIDFLMKEEGWSEDESIDWVNYNVLRSIPYMGSCAPIIMYPLFD